MYSRVLLASTVLILCYVVDIGIKGLITFVFLAARFLLFFSLCCYNITVGRKKRIIREF